MIKLKNNQFENKNCCHICSKIIVVVGHLVWDRIVKPDGGVTEALGGIAYSLSALGAVAESDTRIFPVCNVGYDLYEKARQTLEPFPAIDFRCIRNIKRKNKIHELKYVSEEYRQELNIGEMPKIGAGLFNAIGSIDVLLLNYIGGDEFPPSSIKWLKDKYNPLIYMDYHSLSLGKEVVVDKPVKKVKRHFRYNSHWREYVRCADIVQMNDVELQSIFPGMTTDTDSIVLAAKKVHQVGPKAVIITREDKALVTVRGDKSNPEVHTINVNSVDLVDPTGCGDSLAAGFIISYIKDCDFYKACKHGLELASRKAGFSGLDGYLNLMRG